MALCTDGAVHLQTHRHRFAWVPRGAFPKPTRFLMRLIPFLHCKCHSLTDMYLMICYVSKVHLIHLKEKTETIQDFHQARSKTAFHSIVFVKPQNL